MLEGRTRSRLAGIVAGLVAAAVEAPAVLATRTGARPSPDVVISASQPNQQLISFFQSPAGVALEVLALGAVVVGWTAGVAMWLDRVETTPDRLPRTKTALKRARARRGPALTGREATLARLYRVLAGVVTAAALILPLTFSVVIPDDVFAFPKTVALTTFGIAIGAILVAVVALGGRPARPGILEISLVAYAGLAGIATLTSVNPPHSLLGERTQYQGFISVVDYTLLFAAATITLISPVRARALALAILISSTVAAAYALVQWFGLDPIWAELYKGRVFSTVGQANALATTLAAGAIVGLALEPAGRLQRVAVVGCVALSVAALIVTFSRGGYVAFLIGLVVAGLVMWRGIGRAEARRWAGRLVAGVAVAVVLVAIPELARTPGSEGGNVANRVIDRTASIADANEGSNRAHLDLWTVGLQVALDHPVVGTGPDSYALVFPEYRDRILSPESAKKMASFRPESPHNVYLAIASGAGLPALAAFVALVGSCLVLGLRAAHRATQLGRLVIAGMLGGVTVHLATIVFMTAEPGTFALLWILLGALAGTGRGTAPGDTNAGLDQAS